MEAVQSVHDGSVLIFHGLYQKYIITEQDKDRMEFC